MVPSKPVGEGHSKHPKLCDRFKIFQLHREIKSNRVGAYVKDLPKSKNCQNLKYLSTSLWWYWEYLLLQSFCKNNKCSNFISIYLQSRKLTKTKFPFYLLIPRQTFTLDYLFACQTKQLPKLSLVETQPKPWCVPFLRLKTIRLIKAWKYSSKQFLKAILRQNQINFWLHGQKQKKKIQSRQVQ